MFLAERYRDYQVRDAARHQLCNVNEIQVEDDDESDVSGLEQLLGEREVVVAVAPPLVAIAVWSVTGRDGGRSRPRPLVGDDRRLSRRRRPVVCQPGSRSCRSRLVTSQRAVTESVVPRDETHAQSDAQRG